MKQVKNKFPNVNVGSWQTGYDAFLQIIETYLTQYVDTTMPVQVVSYSNGFVSVKPVLAMKTDMEEVLPITDDDILYNIPVMKIKANGWSVDFSCSAGDFGLLIASKYDISKFKQGGAHKIEAVGSYRTYSFTDGFFLPLDFNTSNENGLKISKGDTSLQLTENSVTVSATTVNISSTTANIEADSVNLGGSVGLGVARIGDSVDLETGKIITGSAKVMAE